MSQIGTGLVMTNGGITLKANTSYRLHAQLSFYTTDTSGSFATYGFYNATKSSWVKGSMASVWGSSWGYQPNRAIDALYTTGSTDEIVDIRCGYSGFSGSPIQILSMNAIGQNTNANTGGNSFFTVEAIDSYQQKLLPLEGLYQSYMHTTLNANYVTLGNNVDVPLSQVLTQYGTDITNNNGVFTLKGGRTYELEACLSGSSTTASNVQWTWVDGNNVQLTNSTVGGFISVTYTSNGGIQPIAKAVITPINDIQVKLRIVYNGGNINAYRGSNIGGTIIDNGGSFGGSYAIIKQLGKIS